nr:hypothetical protein [Spiroplasma endosymbiont of Lariophagus distinguendus]
MQMLKLSNVMNYILCIIAKKMSCELVFARIRNAEDYEKIVKEN